MKGNDMHQALENRGIDYDLEACLEHNPQTFAISEIGKVLAVIEGVKDEDDWHWIIELKNTAIVYMRGGCDYTGWD